MNDGGQLWKDLNVNIQTPHMSPRLTFLCVLLNAISIKSDALGTGAMALNPPNAVAIVKSVV